MPKESFSEKANLTILLMHLYFFETHLLENVCISYMCCMSGIGTAFRDKAKTTPAD